MPGDIQSTMIRASAGSGKTFQLANRYLALMVMGVAPEKIIALTFTRKAAGEFAGRIMTRLANGAASEEGARELAGFLAEIIQGKEGVPALVTGEEVELPTMDTTFFQRKLEELIDVLDRLALSTLDSYFVRIVRNFYLELGLSGFELMEDAQLAAERLGVMKIIFSRNKAGKRDRDDFVQWFKQATWGEEENRLSKTLEDFVIKHQNRWLSNPHAECWGGVSKLWPSGCPYPEGGKYAQRAERVRSLLGDIENADRRYITTWEKACEWMEQRVPGTAIKSLPKRIQDAIENYSVFEAGSFVATAYKREHRIEGGLAAAIADMAGGFIRDEIEIRMIRTRGLYSVISAYEDRYREYVRSRGRLCFADLTLLLAGKDSMRDWDEAERRLIDFRLDARYDHWLLDEFQDTSQPQWQAIESLIDEIMQDAEGQRSLFVVGDSKQSIYGWRGGEPRLFDDLNKHYGDRLAEWDMDRSYRSPQEVLDLVNIVCDLSNPKWLNLFPQAAIKRWVYHEHTPNNNERGHAMVLETRVDPQTADEEDKTMARYACVRGIIEKIRPIENGMSCAVIVSKNSQANAVVDYLREHLPATMRISSSSESNVVDGPVAVAILDLFRWIYNPAHAFGRIHVSMSPLGEVIKALCGSDVPEQQWQWLTQELACHGVEALTIRITEGLRQAMRLSPYTEVRLDEMVAAAGDFSRRGGSIQDWVSMLESRTMSENPDENLIQVMTVHKCKGLGFDVVILPELSDSREFTNPGTLEALERKGDLGITEYVIKRPAKEICAADEALARMLEDWEADQCYERFCNLYVGLTRAQRATYCILDPVSARWTPKKKYADWIREATAAGNVGEELIGAEKYNVLYRAGDWLPDKQEQPQQPGEVECEPEAQLQPVTPRTSSNNASHHKSYSPGDFFEKSRGMRFGDKVHALFEKITWLDEMPELPDDRVGRAVGGCLMQDAIRAHFERPSGEFQLLREQPVEAEIDGEWVSGVIDRALIKLSEGQPVSAVILDFKTDSDHTAESLLLKHTDQIHTYRRALSQAAGIAESDIACYLVSTALQELIAL